MRALRRLAARVLVATLLWSSTAAASGTGTGVEDVPTFATDAGANNPAIGNFQTFAGTNGLVTTGTLSSGLPVITWSLPTISINGGAFTVNSSGNLTKINNVAYSWPGSQGAAGSFLQDDGAGLLTWVTASGAGLVSGTGVATRAAFWSTTTALSSDASFYWDNTNKRLGVGTSTPGVDLDISRSASGATVGLLLSNTSNTASSFANETIRVAGASAEDPTLTFNVSGVTNYTMGIDNSAADHFKLSASTTLGTTDVFDIVSGGASLFNTQGGTFDFLRDDANTNTAINILRITHTTTGTAANNIGTGLLFRSENDAGTTVSVGQIQSSLTTVTAGAETTNLTFATGNAGAALATVFTIAGNGDLTGTGSTDTYGTAGSGFSAVFGQGTTGTDSSTVTIRSGNSGGAKPILFLQRNITILADFVADGTNTFIEYTGNLNFDTGILGATKVTFGSTGKVGIGATTLTSLFNVGSTDQFQVSTAGDIVHLHGIPTTFPSLNSAGVLTNDGLGNYTITAAGANGGGLPTGTINQLLRNNGTAWVATSVATLDSTGSFTAIGGTHNFGTTNVSTTFNIGQGGTTGSAFLTLNGGSPGVGQTPQIVLERNSSVVAAWYTNTTNTFFDYQGTLTYHSGFLGTTTASLSSAGDFTAKGGTHTFGTASTATTMTVGQGTTSDSTNSTLRIRAGDAGTAILALARAGVDKAQLYSNGNSVELDSAGSFTFGFGIGSPTTQATLLPFGKLTLYGTNSDKTNASVTFAAGGLTLIAGDQLKNGILHVLNGGSDPNQSTGVVLSAENVTRDYAQFFTDTIDTFIDFNGMLKFRAGMNGPVVGIIDGNGDVVANGNNHLFGVTGVTTTVSIGSGTVGTSEGAILKLFSGAIPGEPHIELNRAGTMMGRWGTNGAFLTTAFDFNTVLNIRDINSANANALILSLTSAVFGNNASGASSQITAGADTTGTGVGKVTARSGNSGATQALMTLNRNGTDIAEWMTDGTNTFFDYTGTLSFRIGVAGTARLIFGTAGTITTYNTVAKDTNHNGVPFTIASATQTAQTANVAATNLVASATAGRYRLNCYVAVTTQATTSATVPNCNLVCTDPTDSVAKTIKASYAIQGVAANPATSVGHGGSALCDAKAATAIQYSTSDYASAGGTAMQYKVYVTLEQL